MLHEFHLHTNWPGTRNDIGDLTTKGLTTKISIPPEMDGPGIGTNPDEMLLGAAATCYIITLAAMLERSKINKKMLSMDSVGMVEVEKGIITYKKIIHKPVLVLESDASDKQRLLAEKLAHKAESSCMISRALKGNVEIELELTIRIA
ncbi:OsmC family protein [Cytobacillus gottheilii]|uniref:OsmC family protein n=1 Tax=Cytobacillus gottheilii TaxID=859144 RepID=A0ABX8F7H2_9BACI|nr:OsmC family protein [Cytobacillus gottheilii]QVY59904.1 OsmC family protein [Cytobacillus gottheilii]